VSGCFMRRPKVYPQRDPGVLVRIIGQAPIAATVYELGEVAVQSVRRCVYGGAAGGRGREEVR